MLHRIRTAMHEDGSIRKLAAPTREVETDETFVGGRKRNMHTERETPL